MADFEILTLRYIEGTLDAEGAEELLRLLDADPIKRRVLAQHIDLSVLLRARSSHLWSPMLWSPTPHNASERINVPNADFDVMLPLKPEELPVVSSIGSRNLQWNTPPIMMPVMALAFMVLLIWSMYLSLFPPKQDDFSFGAALKPPTPAVMTDVADVQWTGNAPKLGEPLSPGALAFESGTIELLFYNGVRSIIEGPADLVLLGENQLFCRQGKWSVTVPPSGVGFEIQTPHATIRDLGTQFFAAVDAEKCDVHVLKGSVELKDLTGKKTVFKTDQAGLTRIGANLVRATTAPEHYVTKTEMRKRSDDHLRRHPPPVRTALEPILSVDFSQNPPEGVSVYSCSRVSGRSSEHGAFLFDNFNSRIRLPSLGKLTSFSVLIDMKVNRLSDTHPILMSSGSERGGLIWNIVPSGAILFGIRQQTTAEKKMFETPVVFTDNMIGQWMQLGLSVDKSRGEMSVYLNGDKISVAKLSNVDSVDLNALDIGNWKLRTNVAHLHGAVESVLIFDSALELSEIRTREPAIVSPVPH